VKEIGTPEANAILHRLEATYETALRSAHEWSESPDRDVATAMWGHCIKQAGGWIWRRSDDIVFKLSESRRISGVGQENLSIYATFGIEIVLNDEAWERDRKERIVWHAESGWKPGPWWNWLDDFAAPKAIDERLESKKCECSAAWKRKLEAELELEKSLVDAWLGKHCKK
jgi:hypothetical protein